MAQEQAVATGSTMQPDLLTEIGPSIYTPPVTAIQIIAEISALPQQEKQHVIRFTRRFETEMPLPGDELSVLAEHLAGANDAEQTSALREQIMKGFYGST